jgi:acetyl-CoA acetyltransferase
MSNDRRIVILDSEISEFGRHDGHDGVTCASAVATTLLGRHRKIASRVDLVAVGAARMVQSDGLGNGVPQLVGQRIGLPGVAGLEVHAFCASGNAAVHQAATAIAAGTASVALVVGVEHIFAAGNGGPLAPEATPREAELGFSPPVFYALCADRYMHETGATDASLAQVAVYNRRNGASNRKARFREEVSVADVLGSRMIADPLTLLQCCAAADGAGALLIAAADAIGDTNCDAAIDLLGWGSASADPSLSSLTAFEEDARASHLAYERAGIGPEEIGVAEVHDAFTISQIIHLEDIGLAPRGEGWRHALDSEPEVVVNPSGGLLSRGHPLGATGIAQFDSLRRYLTNGSRGASRRRFGLVQEAGGLRALGQLLSECSVVSTHRLV